MRARGPLRDRVRSYGPDLRRQCDNASTCLAQSGGLRGMAAAGGYSGLRFLNCRSGPLRLLRAFSLARSRALV